MLFNTTFCIIRHKFSEIIRTSCLCMGCLWTDPEIGEFFCEVMRSLINTTFSWSQGSKSYLKQFSQPKLDTKLRFLAYYDRLWHAIHAFSDVTYSSIKYLKDATYVTIVVDPMSVLKPQGKLKSRENSCYFL